MKQRTIDYYEQNAAELCERYESVSLDSFHQTLKTCFEPGSCLLEIGCGSGRDAARAISSGFDVAAIDASHRLLKEAQKLHPELDGRLFQMVLPCQLPFADKTFAGFYSVACLMHLPSDDLYVVMSEIHRVVRHGGLVSLPVGRPDVDLSGLDEHGRVFNLMPVEEWTRVFAASGFDADVGSEEADSLGREGVRWVTITLKSRT
ncbi:MAG: methyltransferase [Candidatus Riflebacteria bacterium HGW-Riflebacteria-2]|jgi:SAM-dependent methyltransferase|nr:MAG: methyltransferase [Candidatus Riflebacteria bacterium HGW-Riflebacteria-2]